MARRPEGKLLTRRRFALCCGGAALGLAVQTFVVEPRWLTVAHHTIHVRGLPEALQGLRIAQLSDLHLSSLASIHERVLQELKAFDPTLIVLTGDAVESADNLGALSELCSQLAPLAKSLVATPGNWEYWGHVPREALAKAYEKSSAKLLVNQRSEQQGLELVAIDDFCSGHSDVAAAFAGARADATRLVLTHAPGIFDTLPAGVPPFALGLAGHTHGGQLCALGKSVWLPPGSGSYVEGQYQTQNGPIVVSRGIGMSMVAARLTCRPQLVLITLDRE